MPASWGLSRECRVGAQFPFSKRKGVLTARICEHLWCTILHMTSHWLPYFMFGETEAQRGSVICSRRQPGSSRVWIPA